MVLGRYKTFRVELGKEILRSRFYDIYIGDKRKPVDKLGKPRSTCLSEDIQELTQKKMQKKGQRKHVQREGLM